MPQCIYLLAVPQLPKELSHLKPLQRAYLFREGFPDPPHSFSRLITCSFIPEISTEHTLVARYKALCQILWPQLVNQAFAAFKELLA